MAIAAVRIEVMRLLGVLLLGCVPVLGQPDPVRGREIVDQAIAALGGDSFLHMQDRIERGRAYSFYNEQLSGLSRATIYTRYLTRPEPPPPDYIGQRERQAFGKKEDVFIVFNELGGHEITYRGARPLQAATLQRWKDSLSHNILYILRMRVGEPGLSFELHGTDIFNNSPVNVVDVVDSLGNVTVVYFDRQSKLPVRQQWTHLDLRTRRQNEEVTVFSKFRDIGGGVLWPFVILRERNGEKVFEMFTDEIQLNQGLTDDLFTLPADVKMLDPIKK